MRVGQLKQFLENMDDNLDVCVAGSDDVTDLRDAAMANLTCDFNNNGLKVVLLIYQE